MAKKFTTIIIAVALIMVSSVTTFGATSSATNGTASKTIAKTSTVSTTSSTTKYQRGLAAYIRKVNRKVSTAKSLTMAKYFIQQGNKRNLNPRVLMAIAQNESNFYTGAYNPAGYRGLMQTSSALARKYGYAPKSLYNANVSITVGARYLRTMKNKFGSYTKAISAYAYGEGNVMRGRYSSKLAKRILQRSSNIKSYLVRYGYM